MKTVAGGDTINRNLYGGRGKQTFTPQKKVCDGCRKPLRKIDAVWTCVNPHSLAGRK